MGIPIFSSLGSDAVLSVKLSTGTARRLFFAVADLGQFKAILNHCVVILESVCGVVFWSFLGSFFGPLFGHFLASYHMYYIYAIYLGQFKALSNQHRIILGPFVDPLGTILGRLWGYLAQFKPILIHFGLLKTLFSKMLPRCFQDYPR